MKKISLAQFVSTTREEVGLSQRGLAKKSNLPLEVIESIESGQELFLATPIRQKLAKGLKTEAFMIKAYEKEEDELNITPEYVEEVRLRILAGEESITCPVCKANLITRLEQMYDLEDNLIRHPKARCSKCPFQIK